MTIVRKSATTLKQANHLGQNLDLLSVTNDRIEQEVISTQRHQLIEPGSNLLQGAEHTHLCRLGRVVIHVVEPVMNLNLGDFRALVHRQKHALGDGKRSWISTTFLQRGTEQ